MSGGSETLDPQSAASVAAGDQGGLTSLQQRGTLQAVMGRHTLTYTQFHAYMHVRILTR